MAKVTCPYCGLKLPGQFMFEMHLGRVHSGTPEGAAKAKERMPVVYETKASISHLEQLWRSILFRGRTVRVTTKDIWVEGRGTIPLASVTGCHYKSTLLSLGVPHVRLEYLGDDGTPQAIGLRSVTLTFIQSEAEFATELYEAITTMCKANSERLSGGAGSKEGPFSLS